MKVYTIFRDAWITAIIYSFLPQITHEEISWNGLLLSIAFGIGYALGFALNNYYDAADDATDEIKSKNNYFVNQSLNRKPSFVILFLCFIYFFIIAIHFGNKGLFSLVLLVFILWSYSAEPFKFKKRAGFDIMIHSIFVQTTPYLFTLYLLDFKPDNFDYLMIALLFFVSTSGQIAGQLRDFDIDLKTHETFSIKLGRKRSNQFYYFSIFLISLTVVFGIVFNIFPKFLYPLLLIGAIFIITRSISENPELTHSTPFGPSLGIIALLYTILVLILSITYPEKMTPFIGPL